MSYRYRDEDPKPVHLYPKLNNAIKIDWQMFRYLLEYQTPSYSKAQADFANGICDWLEDQGCDVSRDTIGNVYAVKGQADFYPCAVAHMDINQQHQEVQVVHNEDWAIGIDKHTGVQAGPGFDDKCGVYFCMEMIQRLDAVKIALFVDEEVGCVGSNSCDGYFFEDCSMILQLDRNGYKGPELCVVSNGVQMCDTDFVLAAFKEMEKYKYTPASGVYTDVGTLKGFYNITAIAANIGCGYFDEHSSQETLYIPAYENAINFAHDLMKNLGHLPWKFVDKKASEMAFEKRMAQSEYLLMEEELRLKEEKKRKKKEKKWRNRYSNYLPQWDNGVHYVCGVNIDYMTAHYALSEGFCPCCDEAVEQDIDGMSYCGECGSYWNLPQMEDAD
jgi:tripeptide aminopeptidase